MNRKEESIMTAEQTDTLKRNEVEEADSENLAMGKENQEISQANIAQEYLREYEKWQDLMESHSRILKSLNSASDENFLQSSDDIAVKLEDERKTISEMMDGVQSYMERLLEQLSEETKEKYLKPKSETK